MERSPGSSNGLRELARPLDGTRFDDMTDTGPVRPVSELSRSHRAALEGHILALDADDRRLRFGIPMGDAAVRSYVERIDYERGALFGVFDDDPRLIGAAHLACADKSQRARLPVAFGGRFKALAGRRQCASARSGFWEGSETQ